MSPHKHSKKALRWAAYLKSKKFIAVGKFENKNERFLYSEKDF